MQTQRGFTLIELMIVVAIIAILAAIAISQYQDYLIRTQVAEGSSLADGVKTAAAEFYNNEGHFGATNKSIGLASSGSIQGKYVSDVNAANGKIVATLGKPAANDFIEGGMLTFSAITHAGSIEWKCNPSGGLAAKYVPSVCRNNN